MTLWLCRLIVLLAACFAASAQTDTQRPYVVLVSLDGFRYDYAERYHAKNLLALAKTGAAAEGLIPSFPTVTFPNHISVVTGQYPEHHGVVANTFYDSERKAEFNMNRTATDGSWYRFRPLWVVAEQQNVKSASMFWPASDAEIGGVRPSYWLKYDTKFPNEQRVATVLGWLKLPERERPHFITLYFSDTDTSGHDFGPESPETERAVQRVDGLIGDLWSGIRALSLPVNIIVVSDHGMQHPTGFIDLSTYADLSKVRVVNGGPYALIYTPDAGTTEAIYAALKGKNSAFEVYRRKETPQHWHYWDNPRIGDLVLIAREPTTFVTASGTKLSPGRHGYDPQQFKTMWGIFYAAGPNVRQGMTIKPFENVHIFPFMAKILGLQAPAGLDGSAKVLDRVYKK